MSAINMPAAPVKALFMNVLRDHKLSSGSIMGCRLSQCQCAQSRKVFNLSEKRAKCWTTLISTTSKAWKIRRLEKWQNGSGRNWNLNVLIFAKLSCTKHRLRAAFTAANKKLASGQ